MAIIQKDYGDIERGVRAEDRHDLRLRIRSAAHNRHFEFRVKRNRVEVTCLLGGEIKDGEPNYNDWRLALSEPEKLRVFSLILDEYRKHSIGDEHGYRGAVLGVAENGQIYLGANTATGQITSPYFKECAEQNMVSAASDLVAYQQVKKDGWDKFKLPKAPRFKSLYMMGGVDQTQVPVSCPCGKCTDMLAKNMTENGEIYALPILNQATFNYLNSTSSGVEVAIDAASDTLVGVRDQVTRTEPDSKPLTPYPVWQTTIHHLNAQREIALDGEAAQLQRKAFAKLCETAKQQTHLLEENQAAQQAKAMKVMGIQSLPDLFHAVLGGVLESGRKLSKKAKEILGMADANPVRMAAANQFLGRRSIAQLDVAALGSAAKLSVAINDFMVDEIRHALADRMAEDPEARAGRSWIRSNIPALRCVVIQLNDGTFHHAIECSGKYDASLPNAEAAAVVQALPSLGRCGIRDVWVMEMNGTAIRDGKLMTSPKEGAERIIKRAAQGLKFHYIPLNAGGLSAPELTAMTKDFSDAQLMPALFKGSRPLKTSDNIGKRPWTELVQQQAKQELSLA